MPGLFVCVSHHVLSFGNCGQTIFQVSVSAYFVEKEIQSTGVYY